MIEKKELRKCIQMKTGRRLIDEKATCLSVNCEILHK